MYVDDYEIWVINIDSCYKKVAKYRDLGYNDCDRSLLKLAVFHSSSVDEVTELMIKGGMKDSMVEDLKNTIISKNEDPKFIEELFQERNLELEKQEIAEYNKEQGREEGREEGIEQGIEQGIEKGALQERNNNLKGMLENGIDESVIKKILGVSKPEINAMKKTLSL